MPETTNIVRSHGNKF